MRVEAMEIFSGLFALIILIADIYAVIQVLSSGTSGVNKLVWTLLIIVLPVIGLIIWMFAGPRGSSGVRV
ncbi:PLD nuclease N-terminal domain-containing protein [uncultured Nisaea sp.]|jgi:Phospholipase_D-nuclease N-terminal|uniref:PLD nuclease N-terminal domain-containing protein n=1 Tax=uncultured Nisaea sp. TaxID=538215 RepID=UPI0030ECE029|tara:strand:+ start:676 stop:885 length:210 start_codon:yes stop_codon:yes gene_type:complete